jgi:DNA-binding IclR family transcriptional regulator
VRERGFAVDNEEGTVGLRCFGMALRYETPVLDAISCSVPVARLTEGTEEKIIETLRETRAAIESTALSLRQGDRR